MSRYFDWISSAKRLVRGDMARAEDVNQAFDILTSGLDNADQDIDRAVKLPVGSNIEVTESPVTRANKALVFTADGLGVSVGALGGNFVGDWVTGRIYYNGEMYRDPETGDVYSAISEHTSTSIYADEMAGYTSPVSGSRYISPL